MIILSGFFFRVRNRISYKRHSNRKLFIRILSCSLHFFKRFILFYFRNASEWVVLVFGDSIKRQNDVQ